MKTTQRTWCEYKGKKYIVLWSGQTRYGRRAHLQFGNGTKDFWVDESAIRILTALATHGEQQTQQKPAQTVATVQEPAPAITSEADGFCELDPDELEYLEETEQHHLIPAAIKAQREREAAAKQQTQSNGSGAAFVRQPAAATTVATAKKQPARKASKPVCKAATADEADARDTESYLCPDCGFRVYPNRTVCSETSMLH